MSFPTYSAEAVHQLLDYDGCIAAMRQAMTALSADYDEQLLRSITPLGEDLGRSKLFAVMPGMLSGLGFFGAKVISVFADANRAGRTTHQGVVVLFSGAGGEVLCTADAGAVTHIRTGSATAAATAVLARTDASRLALFGCGAQAESHLFAISRVRRLDDVAVWGRDEASAADFAARMSQVTGLRVRAEPDAQAAAANADIVCTVSGAESPILLREWVRPGTHVNAVGSSHAGPTEVDTPLVIDSRYIVDSRRSALVAAAEFLIARDAGMIRDDHIAGEIGEVILGRVAGRTDDEQITLYKSLGHIVQDLAAVAYVHRRAAASR